MQQERKERLQAAINTVKEIKQELFDGLYDEAFEARGTFDDNSAEFGTLDGIVDYFNNADDHLADAIYSLEHIFGADGADDEPESEDEEEEWTDGDEFDTV